MATRRGHDFLAENAISESYSIAQKRIVEDVEVSRFVEDFMSNTRGSFAQSKVHVCFIVKAAEATAVSLAGTFNGWDVKRTPLRKNGDVWEATLLLPRGKYEYRFVIDGQWVSDPNALESVANPYGSHNSVLSV